MQSRDHRKPQTRAMIAEREESTPSRQPLITRNLLPATNHQSLSTVIMRDLFDASSELVKLLHRKLSIMNETETNISPNANEIKVSQLRVRDMLLPDEVGAELYTAQTPKVRVLIKLPIRMNPQVLVIKATGHTARFREVCEEVKVDIRGIIIKISNFMIEKPDQKLLLKISFERKSGMTIQFLNDESCEARIHSKDGQKRVKYQPHIIGKTR